MTQSEDSLTWKDLEIGCAVVEPGNTSQYRTGDWRSERPIVDRDKCNGCGLCYVYCPEGCINPDDDGKFIPDLFYCKGCGICAYECPRKAITMAIEEEV